MPQEIPIFEHCSTALTAIGLALPIIIIIADAINPAPTPALAPTPDAGEGEGEGEGEEEYHDAREENAAVVTSSDTLTSGGTGTRTYVKNGVVIEQEVPAFGDMAVVTSSSTLTSGGTGVRRYVRGGVVVEEEISAGDDVVVRRSASISAADNISNGHGSRSYVDDDGVAVVEEIMAPGGVTSVIQPSSACGCGHELRRRFNVLRLEDEEMPEGALKLAQEEEIPEFDLGEALD